MPPLGGIQKVSRRKQVDGAPASQQLQLLLLLTGRSKSKSSRLSSLESRSSQRGRAGTLHNSNSQSSSRTGGLQPQIRRGLQMRPPRSRARRSPTPRNRYLFGCQEVCREEQDSWHVVGHRADDLIRDTSTTLGFPELPASAGVSTHCLCCCLQLQEWADYYRQQGYTEEQVAEWLAPYQAAAAQGETPAEGADQPAALAPNDAGDLTQVRGLTASYK